MKQRSAEEARRIARARDKATMQAMRRRVLAEHGNRCHICGDPIDVTLPQYEPGAYQTDHLVPVSMGGVTRLDNCRPSHRRCNRARGTDSVAAAQLRLAGLGCKSLPPPGVYIPHPDGHGFLNSDGIKNSREW